MPAFRGSERDLGPQRDRIQSAADRRAERRPRDAAAGRRREILGDVSVQEFSMNRKLRFGYQIRAVE